MSVETHGRARTFVPSLNILLKFARLYEFGHVRTAAQFEALHKLSPLGRSSTPSDVAATVKFALENQSITGTTLLVDGGQHLMKFARDFSLMNMSPDETK